MLESSTSTDNKKGSKASSATRLPPLAPGRSGGNFHASSTSLAAATTLSKPCSSLEDIESLQRDNLISAIKELSSVEEKRMNRLKSIKSKPERIALRKRYDLERKLDQDKIERLKSDYMSIKSKIASGELQCHAASVNGASMGPRPLPDCAERFHGLDNAEEIRFFRGMCNRLEQIDTKYEAKLNRIHQYHERNQITYQQEQKKLELLNERRDVLSQLITIQRQAQSEQQQQRQYRQNTSRSAASSRLSSRSGGGWSDVGSRRPSSASSTASYATFSSDNLRRHNELLQKQRPKFVPALDFTRLGN